MNDATGVGDGAVCSECGSLNQVDATFCGVCGAYLDWDGRPAPTEQPPKSSEPEAPRDDRPSEPAKATLIDRVKAGLGLEGHAESDAVAEPEQQPPETGAPASTEGPASRQPAAVKPGAVAASSRPKVVPVDEYRARPGETVCGRCDAGNAPERRFCRRCGNELAGSPVVAALPWWRRLFRREPTRVVAGTRPTLRRRSKVPRLLVNLAFVVGLILAAWFAAPLLRGAVDSVRDRVSGTTRVEPTGLHASSAAPGHEAAMARDGDLGTYWTPAAPGDGKGQYIEASFAEPFRLVAIQFFSGASRNDAKFLTSGRPANVLLTVTRSDGGVELRAITLRDDPRQQDQLIGLNDVVKVRMTIQSAFGSSPTKRVALGEVAFFTRS